MKLRKIIGLILCTSFMVVGAGCGNDGGGNGEQESIRSLAFSESFMVITFSQSCLIFWITLRIFVELGLPELREFLYEVIRFFILSGSFQRR